MHKLSPARARMRDEIKKEEVSVLKRALLLIDLNFQLTHGPSQFFAHKVFRTTEHMPLIFCLFYISGACVIVLECRPTRLGGNIV